MENQNNKTTKINIVIPLITTLLNIITLIIAIIALLK